MRCGRHDGRRRTVQHHLRRRAHVGEVRCVRSAAVAVAVAIDALVIVVVISRSLLAP
jgi:hypothetical protein